MRVKVLIAALTAALVAIVAASASTTAAKAAGPPGDIRVTPPHLNFGWVMPGDSVVKPVTITNRTSTTLYYQGAYWPNFTPGSGSQYGLPYGFWNVSPPPPNFPCQSIASESSCTLDFQFTPHDPGNFAAKFQPTYSSSPADSYPYGYNWENCSLGYCIGTTYTADEMWMYGHGLPH